MSAVGAVSGALAAGGALLLVSGVRARRPLRPVERIAPYVAPRAGRRSSPATLEATTLGRIVAPTLRDLVERGSAWWGDPARLEARLVAAGLPGDTVGFRVSQAIWGITGLLLGSLAVAVVVLAGRSVSSSGAVLLLVIAALCGVLLRDRALTRAVRRRRDSVRAALPSVADLLALAVGSGESPMAALDRVARVAHGPLAVECRRACDDTVAGVAFVDALDAMSRRVDVPAVRRFVDGVVIAVQRGTPLADVLRAQAGDARADLHRQLLESAGRKELQMLVPVVFLVLPTVVLVALFPALSSLTSLSP